MRNILACFSGNLTFLRRVVTLVSHFLQFFQANRILRRFGIRVFTYVYTFIHICIICICVSSGNVFKFRSEDCSDDSYLELEFREFRNRPLPSLNDVVVVSNRFKAELDRSKHRGNLKNAKEG